MNIKGQYRSLTFVEGHLYSTFSNFFFLETAWPFEAKFHVAPPFDEGIKVNINDSCHMAKIAAMPIYVKNLLKSYFLEPKGR